MEDSGDEGMVEGCEDDVSDSGGSSDDPVENTRNLIEMRMLEEEELLARDRASAAEALAASLLLGTGIDAIFEDTPAVDPADNSSDDPIRMKYIQTSYDYIRLLRGANIDNDFVDEATKKRLREPFTGILDLSKHPDTILGIENFMTTSQKDKYEAIRVSTKKRSSDIDIPSFDTVKSLVEEFTGMLLT